MIAVICGTMIAVISNAIIRNGIINIIPLLCITRILSRAISALIWRSTRICRLIPSIWSSRLLIISCIWILWGSGIAILSISACIIALIWLLWICGLCRLTRIRRSCICSEELFIFPSSAYAGIQLILPASKIKTIAVKEGIIFLIRCIIAKATLISYIGSVVCWRYYSILRSCRAP